MCRLLKCSKNQPQLFQMTSIGKSVIVYNVINDFWSALGTMRLCTSGGGGGGGGTAAAARPAQNRAAGQPGGAATGRRR